MTTDPLGQRNSIMGQPRLPPDFEQHLRELGRPSSEWLDGQANSKAASAFMNAAVEIVELPNGRDHFAYPQNFNLGSLLTAVHVGSAYSEDGVEFHGVLFYEPERLRVIVWVEEDGQRTRTIWQGDPDAFSDHAFKLMLMDGQHWAHLEDT